MSKIYGQWKENALKSEKEREKPWKAGDKGQPPISVKIKNLEASLGENVKIAEQICEEYGETPDAIRLAAMVLPKVAKQGFPSKAKVIEEFTETLFTKLNAKEAKQLKELLSKANGHPL